MGPGEPFDQICNVSLPRSLDPHSVEPYELSASLGYLLLCLNYDGWVLNICGLSVHNTDFGRLCCLGFILFFLLGMCCLIFCTPYSQVLLMRASSCIFL